MRYQVDFLLPLKLQKICYFGLCHKMLLANRFAGSFTFNLFDLLILIPWVYCYIVFVGSAICELVFKLTIMTLRRVIQLESCINQLQNFQNFSYQVFCKLLELILIENKKTLFILNCFCIRFTWCFLSLLCLNGKTVQGEILQFWT